VEQEISFAPNTSVDLLLIEFQNFGNNDDFVFNGLGTFKNNYGYQYF